MSKITDALKHVITGEFHAIQKYTQFAVKAREENLPNIARIFAAFIVAEKIHLANHRRALGEEFNPEEEAVYHWYYG